MIEHKLLELLRSYITENNPDLLLQLEGKLAVTSYLQDKMKAVQPYLDKLIAEGKPIHIIEELCLNEMTADLKPSRFNLIKEVLETEFLQSYERFRSLGVLRYELVNMVHYCEPVFTAMGFTEDRIEQRTLRYDLTGAISEYLEKG